MKYFAAILLFLCLLFTLPAQTLRDSHGSRLAEVSIHVVIRDSHGSKTGTIDEKGNIRDDHGTLLGRIDDDGTARDDHGSRIGTAKGADKKVAVWYFFFR